MASPRPAQEKNSLISKDEAIYIKSFFRHFKIKMPKGLAKAIAAYTKKNTVSNQETLKIELTAAIAVMPEFKELHPLFTPIIEIAKEVNYHAQFNKDLESALAEHPTKKTR